MSRVVVYVLRFAAMVLGFAVAAMAASLFVHLVLIGVSHNTGEDLNGLIAGSLFVSIPFAALLIGYYAFLPGIVVLVLAELLSRRDWLFYALGGASASLPFLSRMLAGGSADVGVTNSFVAPLALGAGMVGGVAYWAVAGRGAGRWRDAAQEVPSQPA